MESIGRNRVAVVHSTMHSTMHSSDAPTGGSTDDFSSTGSSVSRLQLSRLAHACTCGGLKRNLLLRVQDDMTDAQPTSVTRYS
jgi:hypothetical protein